MSWIMQLETYLLFDSPLLISSSCSTSLPSSWFLFSILFFLFSFLFWYILPLPKYKKEKHSPKHYLIEYNINVTYPFLSDAVWCYTFRSLSNFPSLILFFPIWKRERINWIWFENMKCRTYNRNNSNCISRTNLTLVVINSVVLFHIYLLVPCQVSPSCFHQDHLHLYLQSSLPSLLFSIWKQNQE